jgi:hypothetical protein
MSWQTKTIILFLSVIAWWTYPSNAPNPDPNKPLTYNKRSAESVFFCSNDADILDSVGDKFYLVENYTGSYKNLQSIYQHIATGWLNSGLKTVKDETFSLGYVVEGDSPLEWYRYTSGGCDGRKGGIISYGIDYYQAINHKKIIFNSLSTFDYPEEVDTVKITSFYTGQGNVYTLKKPDIAVIDFVQWVNWVKQYDSKAKKNQKNTGDSTILYELYNQDKTQHVEMRCKDWCEQFDLSLE